MFKVLSRVTRNLCHEDHFDTEAEARAAANHAYLTGAYQVELYQKTRTGYVLIQVARQTMQQAAKRAGEWLASDLPELM